MSFTGMGGAHQPTGTYRNLGKLSAHREGKDCKDGGRRKRGNRPGREGWEPCLGQQFDARMFLGMVWHERDTHLAMFTSALEGQVLYSQRQRPAGSATTSWLATTNKGWGRSANMEYEQVQVK